MEALQSAEKALQTKAASAMPAQDSLRVSARFITLYTPRGRVQWNTSTRMYIHLRPASLCCVYFC